MGNKGKPGLSGVQGPLVSDYSFANIFLSYYCSFAIFVIQS